ncbi:hypothetical protein HGB13_00630 [bacterium]|nr:hypothetical protein [bacterium]
MFTFSKENLIKIAKGAGIAMGGALLTYLAQFISSTDFGIYTPVVVALGGILINAGREFLKK